MLDSNRSQSEGIKCIDFSFCDTSEQEKLRVGKLIAKSFEEIGFAYICNHGIPQAVIDEANNAGNLFFELPEKAKKKYAKKDILKQGFVAINREKLYTSDDVQELRECYDVADKDGIFPDEVQEFKPSIIRLIEYAEKMANTILQCIELGLGITEGRLSKEHHSHFSDKSGTLLRILHYPPLPEDVKRNATRCGTHTDYGTFTLLFQDQIGGLEVLNRRGEWVKADPIPGTILINVGDLLQMWTGGRFIATKHRVLIPDEELKQRRARKSIVLFFHPEDNTVVRPLMSSENFEPPVRAMDHRKLRYNETYKY